MKNKQDIDKQVALMVSNVIAGVEKDLFSQLDFSDLQRQLAEFKITVSVLPDVLSQFTKDQKVIACAQDIVKEYQKSISLQEKELEKIDAVKAAMDKTMWCIAGATKEITQLVMEKEADKQN
jgi:hypothetical protein